MPPPRATTSRRPPPPLRLGLIGCGRLGAGYYVGAIAGARDLSLVALAEPDPGRLRAAIEAAAALGGGRVRACSSAAALLDSDPPQAVVIAGPPETHLEHAALAAAAGVPALVEKPPGTCSAQAEALAALDPAPRIGFNRRFTRGGELVAALPLGPVTLELELSYLRARWRPYTARADALADVGSHLVDLALLALGPGPLRARALELERGRAVAELDGGGRRAVISCSTARPWRERVVVRHRGRAGSARVIAGGPIAAIGARVRRRADPLSSSLVAQLEAFGRSIRGGGAGVLATADEGVAVMRAIEAIRCSARSGAWEPVASSSAPEPEPLLP